MVAPDWRSAVQSRRGAAADGTSNPPTERVVAEPARARPHRRRGRPGAGRVARYFTRLAEAEGLPAAARSRSTPPTCTTSCPAAGRHHAPAPGRTARCARRRSDRGAGPGERGTRLADRHDPLRPDGADPGGDERDWKERYAVIPDESSAMRWAASAGPRARSTPR